MSKKKASTKNKITGPGWVRTTVALVLFGAVTAGSIMYSSSLFDEAKSERIAREDSDAIVVDSIYSDRVEGKYDPDYDRTRYQEIAQSLEQDPIFIDEYQAFEIDNGDIDQLRTELNGQQVPIYVAIVAGSDFDGADGDADLTAARIAKELKVDQATVLVLSNLSQGLGHKGVVRTWDERPETEMHEKYSRTALNYVRALEKAEVYDGGAIYSSTTDENGNPVVVAEDTRKSAHDLKYSAGSAAAGAIFGALGGAMLGGILLFVVSLVRDKKKKES